MTRIGSLANTKLIDWDVEASIYVSLALLRPGRQVDPGYLYAYTLSRRFIQDVEDRSLLWAIPKKINMGDISHVPVLLPASRKEQQAIAEVVRDSERALASLRGLLAKKAAILQGAMQELLSGGVRLAGFTSPWRDVTLGDVSFIKTGSRNNQDKDPGGRYPFYVRSASVERINSYSYDCEAVLVPGEGGIGSIFHYVNGKFEVHQRVYKISDFDAKVAGRFIYYYMRQHFGRHAAENSVKATVDSLRLPTFQNFQMCIPDTRQEQLAIAQVLNDMVREIESIQRRYEKADALSRGLVQTLVSGRARLSGLEVVA